MVILRNPKGTVELKGADLTIKEHGDWITIFHGSCQSSEQRSHLHLRKKSYHYACIRETEGYTPQMTFWIRQEDVCDDKPEFAVYFPSFYDWSEGKKPLLDHHQHYREWVKTHGREFELR